MVEAPSFTADELGARVAVTGGCGYLGRALIARLVASGCEVVSIDLGEHAPPGSQPVRADIRDYTALRDAFSDVDTVFHTAALIAIAQERFTPPARRRLVYEVNVVGTENAIRAARDVGASAFVHASTFNVVMDHPIDGSDESLPYATNSKDLYTLSKIAAERAVLAADSAEDGLRTCAIRPGGIWGPGEGSVMMDRFAQELARGAFKATIGDGATPLDNSHVENVVDAMLLAARALRRGDDAVGGSAYFITDGERHDAMAWFRPFVEAWGEPFPQNRVPGAVMMGVAAAMERAYRVGVMKDEPPLTIRSIRNLTEGAHFSVERARRELGYVPRFTRDDLPSLVPALRARFAGKDAG